jgi:hypothetical protein
VVSGACRRRRGPRPESAPRHARATGGRHSAGPPQLLPLGSSWGVSRRQGRLWGVRTTQAGTPPKDAERPVPAGQGLKECRKPRSVARTRGLHAEGALEGGAGREQGELLTVRRAFDDRTQRFPTVPDYRGRLPAVSRCPLAPSSVGSDSMRRVAARTASRRSGSSSHSSTPPISQATPSMPY